MEQAEKKFIITSDQIEKLIEFGYRQNDKNHSINISEADAFIDSLKLSASQSKSPPVIDEKGLPIEGYLWYNMFYKTLDEIPDQGDIDLAIPIVSHANTIGLSLSSERAMEFAEWTSRNGFMFNYVHGDWCNPSRGEANKSTPDLFDIFCKEKGYLVDK